MVCALKSFAHAYVISAQ